MAQMPGALSGLSAAAGVLIGKRLGKKEYDAAYEESGKIMKAGLLGAVVVSGVLMLFSGSYVSFYRVDTTVQELGQSLFVHLRTLCTGEDREYDTGRRNP